MIKRLTKIVIAAAAIWPIQAQAAWSIISFVSDPLVSGLKYVVSYAIALAAFLAVTLISGLVALAGWLFDLSVEVGVVKFANFVDRIPAIGETWSILRNTANLLLIFALLYIAFNIVLQLRSGQYRRLLAKVLVIALLINFSFFFTRVVIDFSNVVATQFYRNIVSVQQSQQASQGRPAQTGSRQSISGAFMQASGIVGLFSPEEGSWSRQLTELAGGEEINPLTALTKSLSIIIFYLIAIVVFIAGAVMFVIRIISLIILIILSPLAFMAYAVPGLEKHAGKWGNALLKKSFFAPVAMFFIFASFKVIQQTGGWMQDLGVSQGSFERAALTGLNFSIMLGLLVGSLLVAENLGAAGAGAALGGLKRLGTYAAGAATGGGLGLAARLGRGTLGRMAGAAAEMSEASTGRAGRLFHRAAGRVAGASFDVRSTKLGKDLLKTAGVKDFTKAGGKGGYEATQAGKEAKKEKTQQETYERIKAHQGGEAANQWLESQTGKKEIYAPGTGAIIGAAAGAAVGLPWVGAGIGAAAQVAGRTFWQRRHQKKARKHRATAEAAKERAAVALDPVIKAKEAAAAEAYTARAERRETKARRYEKQPVVSPELHEDLTNKREKGLVAEINRLKQEFQGRPDEPRPEDRGDEQINADLAKTESKLTALLPQKTARRRARVEAQKKLGKKPGESAEDRIKDILETERETAKGEGGPKE